MWKALAMILNFFNNLLHIEVISILADGFFWVIILLVGFPLAAVVALVRMIWQVITHFVGGGDVDPKALKTTELAVLVTGCDSGFGKDLVPVLTAKGFTVFCGCLHATSLTQYQDDPLAAPLVMDVTSDKSVTDAYEKVSEWLSSTGSGKQNRHLHALVNNAGIAHGGFIDWRKMSDFEASMDVNYFGMIRCVKQFLPIFKQQAADRTYSDARIVNMISTAGFFSGGAGLLPTYASSKHAADVLTANLRLEMKYFGVKVIAINPSFHRTPMADRNAVGRQLDDIWKNMPVAQREEYGEGKSCYKKFLLHFPRQMK
jgi:NAD(P)-dependent dehydrogenase (short-subunit alcohol dehydrogenase family)